MQTEFHIHLSNSNFIITNPPTQHLCQHFEKQLGQYLLYLRTSNHSPQIEHQWTLVLLCWGIVGAVCSCCGVNVYFSFTSTPTFRSHFLSLLLPSSLSLSLFVCVYVSLSLQKAQSKCPLLNLVAIDLRLPPLSIDFCFSLYS